MAGKKDTEYQNVPLLEKSDSTSDADPKNQHTIKPHAIELITFDLDNSLTNSEDSDFKDSKITRILKSDYISTDDRVFFQNKVINGFDVLTLTLIRIFLQVGYKEFTTDNTTPFMEAMTEDPRWAGPIVTLLCLLAFLEVYQAYQQQQAKKLRNDAAQLAQFRRDSEEGKKTVTVKAHIEDLQAKVQKVYEQGQILQGKYASLSVQYEIEDNKCKVYLVATPKVKNTPEQIKDKKDSPGDMKLPVEENAAEGTKKDQKDKDEKGLNWPSIGAFLWEVLNISAVVYWVEWGLRNLVKPGGFGLGFGTASGMNIVIPFAIILPVIVPLSMIAPKLFNYINTHHRPTDKQPKRKKLWDGVVKKLFKPTPNPLQGTKVPFLGYIISEVVNFFGYLAGFFFVAPTMLGIGVKKVRDWVFAKKTESAAETSTNALAQTAAVSEGSEEFIQKFTEDAPSILSQVILLDKYEKAGVTLASLQPPEKDAVKLAQSGSQVIAEVDQSTSSTSKGGSPSPKSGSDSDSDESQDPSVQVPLLSTSVKSDEATESTQPKKLEKRGPFSWFSLFALRSAIGYIYLQFTLGWWLTDLITIFNPNVAIEPIATGIAAAIIGLSLAYALIITLYRKREYEKYFAPSDEKGRKEKVERDAALALLAKKGIEIENELNTVKENTPIVQRTEIEKSDQYKKLPKINDSRYFQDIRINDKTLSWLSLCVPIGGVIGFLAKAETGIWIGRGANIDNTAIHPMTDPWNRTIPWENQFPGPERHFFVITAILAIATLYVIASYYNAREDQKIEGEIQKAKQSDEHLLHRQRELSFWKSKNNSNSSRAGTPSTESENESKSGSRREESSSPETPPSKGESVNLTLLQV